MANQMYTPEQALEMLLEKLRVRDQVLANQVQSAIDAGKDVRQTEPSRGKRKMRAYRKKVPYSNQEALHVVLDALRAYFVEQPLLVESAYRNLAGAAIGFPKKPGSSWMYSSATIASEPEPVELEGIDLEKNVEIEIQTETQISKSDQEMLSLAPRPHDEVIAQERRIDLLRQLIEFR